MAWSTKDVDWTRRFLLWYHGGYQSRRRHCHCNQRRIVCVWEYHKSTQSFPTAQSTGNWRLGRVERLVWSLHHDSLPVGTSAYWDRPDSPAIDDNCCTYQRLNSDPLGRLVHRWDEWEDVVLEVDTTTFVGAQWFPNHGRRGCRFLPPPRWQQKGLPNQCAKTHLHKRPRVFATTLTTILGMVPRGQCIQWYSFHQ